MTDNEKSILSEFLAERDEPCPHCQYNLRNLQGNVCPECGCELVIGLRSTDDKRALFLAGLIGLSSGAGLNGWLVVYAFIIKIEFFRHGVPNLFWAENSIGLLVLGFSLSTWLRSFRKIGKLSSKLRWVLVIGCWLLSAADITVFSLTIR